MNLLLSIDTAGSDCAVALSTPGGIVSTRILSEPRIHSSRLVPLIVDIVKDAGFQRGDIGAVAVSKGPGSYTGLRIGVSTAKGLAFGLDIPLVGVATFEALAWANLAPTSSSRAPDPAYLMTTAPSRRHEIYWQVWRHDADPPRALTEPRSDMFDEVPAKLRRIEVGVTLIGDGADVLHRVLEDAGLPAAVLGSKEVRPAILGVSALGHRLLDDGNTEDVALFEPLYLKEFVAKKGGSPFDRLPF